jgi:hypothetical protein
VTAIPPHFRKPVSPPPGAGTFCGKLFFGLCIPAKCCGLAFQFTRSPDHLMPYTSYYPCAISPLLPDILWESFFRTCTHWPVNCADSQML